MLIISLKNFSQVINKLLSSTIDESFNIHWTKSRFLLTINWSSYHSIVLSSYLIYNIFNLKLSYEDNIWNVSNKFWCFNDIMHTFLLSINWSTELIFCSFYISLEYTLMIELFFKLSTVVLFVLYIYHQVINLLSYSKGKSSTVTFRWSLTHFQLSIHCLIKLIFYSFNIFYKYSWSLELQFNIFRSYWFLRFIYCQSINLFLWLKLSNWNRYFNNLKRTYDLWSINRPNKSFTLFTSNSKILFIGNQILTQ